eukprot:COSAG02_NODE_181_length_30783_cov_53.060520_31_plen_120_part_00
MGLRFKTESDSVLKRGPMAAKLSSSLYGAACVPLGLWRAGARAGTGEARRPDHRVIWHHPGRWPARLSTPARHSRPFESGLLRGKADRSFHYVPRCLVAAVRRVNGGGRTSKQGLCAPD